MPISKKSRIIPLKRILSEFPLKYFSADNLEIQITGIVMDSRRVEAGNLYVAIRGESADGHNFIKEAISRGAGAIVAERDLELSNIPYIKVENSRQALTWLAAGYYDHPGRKLTVIGVTGTDGKTTTCNLLFQILLAAKIKTGLISTVNAVIGDEVLDTGFHVTTPDAPDVQSYMAQMVDAGLTHVILETTSHGLAQYRVDACEFDIGIITNITHEHLDQHGTYENYRAAKSRLFELLDQTKTKKPGKTRLAVLNIDDSSYGYLSQIIGVSQVSYGLNPTATVHAESINFTSNGLCFDAIIKGIRHKVESPLMGEFNVSNCLAAYSAALFGLGLESQTIERGIAAMAGVPGRMEQIDLGQSFIAMVDFAHTPNALRVAIETFRGIAQGKRVIVIFGSAGLRDREKRKMMAEVAINNADISILTAEDPRTESLGGILDEMAAGALSQGGVEEKTFFCVPDRGEAIKFGVNIAQPGDVVVACGKGHEQSMCFGTTEYPWDDRTAMRAALAELLGIHGPEMPQLPTSEEIS
jgi:UDP-N-acetylmuramoyl-L-alanyl-D-glutamate--2,6-diaminopimelate ligase